MTQTYDKRLLTEASGISVIALPKSNGTDDTSTINTILASAAGKVVRGRHGEVYLISAPLVLPLGGAVTLDMSKCEIRLSNSASCNMLNNGSVTPNRSVADAAITSGTTALTSATATFTSADVGRSITVAGAAVGGDLLVTTITAVASGTSATLSAAASTTVSGATAAIYSRDSRIHIIGGLWNRQNAGPAGGSVAAHNMRFRHVDGLQITDASFTSTNGKYAISLGDVTQVKVENPKFLNTKSDGVHIAGPSSDILVRGCSGTTGDDMVAITAQEPSGFTGYNDTLGPVSNVVIEDINPIQGGSRAVLLCAGRSGALSHVRVANVGGSVTTTQPGVLVYDDLSASMAGLIEDVTIQNVSTVTPSSQPQILVQGQLIRQLKIRDVHANDAAKASGVVRFYTPPGLTPSLSGVTIRDLSVVTTNKELVTVDAGTTIDSLIVDGVQLAGTAGLAALVQVNGTVTDLVLRGVVANFTTGSSYAVTLGAAATVGRATISDTHLRNAAGGGGVVSTFAAGTGALPVVHLSNVVADKLAWIADLAGTTDVYLSNVTHTNPTAGVMIVRATGVVTVRGESLNLAAGGSGLNVLSGGVVNGYSLMFPCDVSKLAKVANGLANNTNAGLSCGAGPVVCNGTTWKHLYSGATY